MGVWRDRSDKRPVALHLHYQLSQYHLPLAPYHIIQPQSNFASKEEQEHSIIGNRAGVMAREIW